MGDLPFRATLSLSKGVMAVIPSDPERSRRGVDERNSLPDLWVIGHMLVITPHITIADREITFTTMRAGGPGGQHVNKVETAVLLKFDFEASALPDQVKERLRMINDHRILDDGTIHIKVQETRSQQRNKEIALERLRELVVRATYVPKKRKATKPSKAAKQKRLEEKKRKSALKASRNKPRLDG